MGSINIDNTGSGSGITLSSDGTDLLLDGTAVGGGGGDPDLYRDNASGATTPVASGTNAVAIGTQAEATASNSIALGFDAVASGALAFAAVDGTASGVSSIAIGESAVAGSASSTIAIGRNTDATGTDALAIGSNAQSTGSESIALGQSLASGGRSFAAAIDNNTSSYGATSSNSIAIGRLSKASGAGSLALGADAHATDSNAVAIGIGARASQNQSIAIGENNTASGVNSIAVGPFAGTASGNYSICMSTDTSSATELSSIAIGDSAVSNIIGAIKFSSGRFDLSGRGQAQGGQFILRADTTDATATVLTTNNSAAAATNQIAAPVNDTCITFDGTITAMQNGAQAYASWKIEGLLVNDGGTTTLANSATTVIQNLSSWGMALSADNTNNALAITVTGEASHNIRWVANIRTTEVTYA